MICYHCAHECKLKLGQIGRCGVNTHTKDGLVCDVYGYPNALHVDPIEKKPLYHVLPTSSCLSLGTIGCNFFCDFCQNWQLSQAKTFDKKNYLSPKDIVNLAKAQNCKSIACTYNEPTIFYPYAKDIATLAKKENIKNIWVSNGFYSKQTCDDLPNFLDAINIDLKAFNKDFYKKIGGDLDTVCQNLITLSKRDIWLEITTLIIPGRNDSPEELNELANFIAKNLGPHVPWHISAFHPAYKATSTVSTPQQTLDEASQIGKDAGLLYVYQGNNNTPNFTKCPNFDFLLIERTGFNTKILGLDEKGCCLNCKRTLEGVYL
ncbi:MAG: AmmeMemoRadiSam system radical SAM enzyme [Campylobacteraceae bacterium]|nr:AmmeMemoRadiSam system radical SAM enzyme [Campylobacteraceae bacterium]